jgi:biopolymer transport protein ExbB
LSSTLGNFYLLRFGVMILGLIAICVVLNNNLNALTASPQTDETEETGSTSEESSSAGSSTDATSEGTTKAKPKRTLVWMLFEGDALGVILTFSILALSVVAGYFVIEHALSITKAKLMPETVLAELETRIGRGEIDDAIEFCRFPDNNSLVSEVILAGLETFRGSDFGFAEYKSAVEEAGEDQTSRLYRKTEVLSVIAAIAPMMGLLGTVLGMITAFNTLAEGDGMAKPQDLAGGISQALVTTLLGLFVAIPTMVAYSYFRNKIDSIVAEAGKRIERILMPLGRKRQ